MRLKHKVAVITGGASGMGEASVYSFLKEGAKVVIADFNEVTGKETLSKAQQIYRGQVDFIKADVASECDIQNMFDFALERFGRIDVVFNNAGVGGAVGPLTQTSVESWDYTMDVIAKGVFLGIKHGAKQMQKQGSGGSIINTASIAALSGDGGPLVYSAGKAAVVSLTKASAVELAPDKIRVNAICPGFIATPLADGGNPEQTRESFSKSQPWPEYGDSHHIASTALFLASNESSFITGESIVVDGGLTAAGPELSKKFPRTSGRNARVTGVTKGSTGEAPEITRLD